MILDTSFHTIGGHIKLSTFPNNPYFVVGGAQCPHQNVLSTTPTIRYTKARLTTLSRFKVVVRFKGCLWKWVMLKRDGGGLTLYDVRHNQFQLYVQGRVLTTCIYVYTRTYRELTARTPSLSISL